MTIWSWILLTIVVLVVIFLYKISQPPTIYQNRPGWIVMNEWSGLPCDNGRVYKTKERAEAEAEKLRKSFPLLAFFEPFVVVYVSKEDLESWWQTDERQP